ncbi:hypothetical protein B0H17DRAFT_1197747 [Mycena rosella]|uniref:Uncharacterized protein n=1 Tax=Mycena rosella TaxID=1033263 RepID=A0AAD7DSG1_MYCRO|nr:hypothetical protein B0H17DRAFT_1197747 [Mycena rosella]
MAAEAKVHPHLVTLVSTMVSTGLAACSSFLFSFGVRRSIALRLRRPMSLAKLFSAVSISARSLVLSRHKWQWTLMSISIVILIGIQTSGWFTLLTPVAIVIETLVRSSELDLASPRLRQMASSGALDTCIYTGSYLTLFDVGRTESGSARAKHHLVPENSLGFNYTSAYTIREPNYLLMIACGPVDNYTLIFESAGGYKKPATVCTFSPKITRVNVEYSNPELGSGIVSTTTLSDGVVRDPEGPGGLSAVSSLSNMLFLAQGILTNIMGEEILSLLAGVPEDTATLTLMAEYIRGVAECSASVLRTCLSVAVLDGLPDDITVPTTGIIFIHTVGWTRFAASSIWVFIPGTPVALATIVVVVVAVAQHAYDPPSDLFDPSNGMHLVAAAAAGGLHDAFDGTNGKDLESGERIHVVLGSIPGRGAALIRTDQM